MSLRATKGFVTGDGVFFEKEEDAIFHEARRELADAVIDHGVDPDSLMRIIHACDKEIERYITAYRAADREGTSYIVGSESHFARGSEEVAPELEQSVDGHGDMPNVGLRDLAEAVADQGTVDGTRGRGDDAPGVRDGEDLAVDKYPRIAKAGISYGEPVVRSEKVAGVPKDV